VSDIEPHAIKIGMLATGAIVRVVARVLAAYSRDRAASNPTAIVVDPVMAATAGGALLDAEGIIAVRDALLPLATVVTPNTIEAERLTGMPVSSAAEAHRAAARLVSLGAAAAIVTGGHLDGPPIDVLFDGVRAIALESVRLESRDTHGTGCAFSAALAARLALGDSLEEAARHAKAYVTTRFAEHPVSARAEVRWGTREAPRSHRARLLYSTGCASLRSRPTRCRSRRSLARSSAPRARAVRAVARWRRSWAWSAPRTRAAA